MTKRDRIAIVATVIYALLPVGTLLMGRHGEDSFVFSIPIILYWGYRFIKDDISFIGDGE